MKKSIILILSAALLAASCVQMDLPSKNKVSDEDLLTSPSGMTVYMARLYSHLPLEDFKYMAKWGLNKNAWLGGLGGDGTGESINRDDICRSFVGEDNAYWDEAFTSMHDANHLIETLPNYRSNFNSEMQYNEFLGEGYFVRAFVLYQMARRYGGVPLAIKQIDYDPENPDNMELPRASEEETWEQICADFTKAAELLPETSSKRGYANKYVALTYKAEAMLYAGSIAKYNETVSGRLTGLGEKTGVRVIGFEESKAAELSKKWFSESYKAAREVMNSGKYSLYKKAWKAGNREAQYQNMVDMWKDLTSPENIFVREYSYPTVTHGIDAYSSPYYWHAPLAGGSCPTLDFVELFDGLPRYPNGQIRTTTGNGPAEGTYEMYETTYDLFKDAEPRLRAYVILPDDTFRGRKIEVYAGIYTGSAPVSPFFSDYSYSSATTTYTNLDQFTNKSNQTLFMSPNPSEMTSIKVNGQDMTTNGSAGPWYSYGEATVNGFHLRKYLDPDLTLADIGEGKSDQPFILMRYADVLLAAAEAGVELAIAGAPSPVEGDDMLAVATQAIRDIRERAGADELTSALKADNESRDIVRRERRKELAFEHKSKWDIRRWRVCHEEGRAGFWGEQRDPSLTGSGSNFRFRGLFPFYSTATGKDFFDARFRLSVDKTFGYSPVDYYFAIPSNQVSKSKYIDQQPNR